MSEENVEIVRRAYEAFNRGDRDGAVADLAPNAEYIPSEAFPESRVRRGPEDVKNFMSWLWDEFEDARLDTDEFIDIGDESSCLRPSAVGGSKAARRPPGTSGTSGRSEATRSSAARRS
jgi:ketosteroid isomerase-like protein